MAASYNRVLPINTITTDNTVIDNTWWTAGELFMDGGEKNSLAAHASVEEEEEDDDDECVKNKSMQDNSDVISVSIQLVTITNGLK